MNTTQTVMVQSKGMLTSRTFWVNLIVGLLAITSEIQAMLPAFADILVMPPTVARWLLLATAVANIVLRRISDQPARFNPGDDAVPLPKAGSQPKTL
jgi:hypothetical protein